MTSELQKRFLLAFLEGGGGAMIVRMEVVSDVDELNRVIGFVDGVLEGIAASKKSVLQLELAV